MNQSLAYEVASVMPNAYAESGIFVSLCTIQAPDGTIGPSGQLSGNYLNVAGLVNIPCTAPPLATGTSIQATEVKELTQILALTLTHVLLNGYYPAIEAVWRNDGRAIVDGVSYDILGVEVDSQATQTRLRVRVTSI